MKRFVVTRGIAELLLIVVGVLIALGLDNWNQDRVDRALSGEYLSRLVGDLEADVALGDLASDSLEVKSDALAFLLEAGRDRETGSTEASRLVRALPESLARSFNTPPVRTVTIDDMRSTGRLSLITNAGLREEILHYYALATNSESRLEGRMTDYPARVFERVPAKVLAWRDVIPVALTGDLARRDLEPPELTQAELDELLDWLGETETQRLVNAEMNYSIHAIRIVEDDRARAMRLIELLERSRTD